MLLNPSTYKGVQLSGLVSIHFSQFVVWSKQGYASESFWNNGCWGSFISLDSLGSKSEQQNLSAPVSWSKPQYPGGPVLLKSENENK